MTYDLTWDFSRCGMAVLVIVNADLTLTFMDLSNCSSVVVRISPFSMMPALFTTLSRPEGLQLTSDETLDQFPLNHAFWAVNQGSHFLELHEFSGWFVNWKLETPPIFISLRT